MQQADVGEGLINQYSWATPDTRCLEILRHFSPLIEIGCGANAYWSRYMSDAGIDIVAYDVDPQAGGTIDGGTKKKNNNKKQSSSTFTVQKGGPNVLKKESGRTLFLCYPDEDGEVPLDESQEATTSMGAACLEYYSGDHVIHVGELFGDTLSVDQAPWGRSSGPEFQVRLALEYHCILKATLSNWLHVKDTISVWKRTKTCPIVFAADSDDDDEEEDEEVQYRHIPVEERLPTDVAAPCLAHLLREETGESGGDALVASVSKKGVPLGDQRKHNGDSTGIPKAAKEDANQDYVCPW